MNDEQEHKQDFEVIMTTAVSHVPWTEGALIVRVHARTTDTTAPEIAFALPEPGVGCPPR